MAFTPPEQEPGPHHLQHHQHKRRGEIEHIDRKDQYAVAQAQLDTRHACCDRHQALYKTQHQHQRYQQPAQGHPLGAFPQGFVFFCSFVRSCQVPDSI